MADYLERYAAHFQLPVMNGVRVDRLSREGDRYLVKAGALEFEAEHVVVAMASYQGRRSWLRERAVARHRPASLERVQESVAAQARRRTARGRRQLGCGDRDGDRGAGHPTWISGRDPGQVPFPIENVWAQRLIMPFLFRVVFHRILTVNTPMGRKARAKMLHAGAPRIRQRRADLDNAGVEWVARTAGVKEGRPRAGGRPHARRAERHLVHRL